MGENANRTGAASVAARVELSNEAKSEALLATIKALSEDKSIASVAELQSKLAAVGPDGTIKAVETAKK